MVMAGLCTLLVLSSFLYGARPATALEDLFDRADSASVTTPPTEIVPARPCVDETGPGIEPIAPAALGLPGYHAALYARSGNPILCPGSSATETVGILNTGSYGWYANRFGATAYLGISGDKTSVLGDEGIGWVGKNRVAVQGTDYVGPGQVAWFTFKVRAPQRAGIYRLAMKPVIEGTQWLEDEASLSVTVKSAEGELPAPEVERTYYPAIVNGVRTIRVPSMMYHYVDWLPAETPDRFRIDLTVSPKDFEDQLTWLKAQGYTTVTTSQLWWTLDQGAPLPAKPIQLTFDDGYVSHYTFAMPLLKKYGFTGTFFVTANLVGRAGYLTKDQVRGLVDGGMDVQSHAVDHYPMSALPLATQQYQMCVSRRILSEWTGTDVRHFAFPSGDYNATSLVALPSCGYLSSYKKAGGSVQSSDAMFTLQRSRVRGQAGLAALLTALKD